MAAVIPVKRARGGYAWRVMARDEHKKMKQETFSGPDAVAVEKAARTFARLVDRVGITEASRIRTQRSGAATRGAPTVGEWTDAYLDKSTGILAGITDATRADYRRDANRYIVPRLGELPVDHVDVDEVARWVVWLEAQQWKGKPLAAKTVRSKHTLLSQILGAAAVKGHRTGNPARGAKLTRQRKRKMVVLTASELAVLLHFLPEQWRPLVLWLAGTGMRWGEATALTWGDLDRDARPMLVHIDKAWQRTQAGQKRTLGPPKTDAGERTISVPDSLVSQLGKPGRGDALIFPSRTGKALLSASFNPHVWSPALTRANGTEACEAAGLTPIGKRPRVHDLRHFHASALIGAGRPLPYIQARLGHEKITTTVDTYGHLLPDAQQGDADAVAVILGASLPELVELVAALPEIEG
ncbi:tyrosine-type recombinase/integrase [Promicromonospora vindobonensis]|uniref:Tyrosine-type recombinase/integrase n=1 Tax=Promicromonospora vindobonensis TaxID=195748 RepID=A0ABW5VLF9_9MICO